MGSGHDWQSKEEIEQEIKYKEECKKEFMKIIEEWYDFSTRFKWAKKKIILSYDKAPTATEVTGKILIISEEI